MTTTSPTPPADGLGGVPASRFAARKRVAGSPADADALGPTIFGFPADRYAMVLPAFVPEPEPVAVEPEPVVPLWLA